MRSYYASYGDTFTPYEIHKPEVHATSLVLPQTSTYNSKINGNECEIDVKLAVKSKFSVPTNAEVATQFLEDLKTAGTTSIPKVDNFYKIEVAYAVINNWTGEVVDDTIQIRYAKAETCLMELGLNDLEFVAKPAFRIKSRVSRIYSSRIPYGMMRQIEDHDSYGVAIRAIRIYQAVTSSLDMKPVNEHADYARHMSPHPPVRKGYDDPHHPMRYRGDRWDCPAPYFHPHEPEVQYGDYGNRVVNPYTEFVLVYDTNAAGIVFEPVSIRRISKLTINVNFITTDFVAIIDSKVNDILTENTSPVPPVTKPDEIPSTGEEETTDPTEPVTPPVDDPDSPYDKEDNSDTEENPSTGDNTGEAPSEGTDDQGTTGDTSGTEETPSTGEETKDEGTVEETPSDETTDPVTDDSQNVEQTNE